MSSNPASSCLVRRVPLARSTRLALAALELFLGVGAVYGGIRLLTDAERFGIEKSWLDGTPFDDYTIPGLVLLAVIGGGMLAAAVLALAGSEWAALAGFWMGAILLVFLSVETIVIGNQGSAQVPLLAVCGGSALTLIVIGSRAFRV
jgi:hypothetical protein